MAEVYLRFESDERSWVCTLSPREQLDRPIRVLRFSDSIKVRELAERAGGLGTLERLNLFELGLQAGRGGMMVTLTPDQMRKLRVR